MKAKFNLTVKDLTEQLLLLPQDAIIVTDGYEDGLDTIVDTKIINIALNKNTASWCGCYEEDKNSEQVAIYLFSTRGSKI